MEKLGTRRVSTKTIQKTMYPKAGVSKWSPMRPLIEVYFELHLRLFSGGFLLKLAADLLERDKACQTTASL